MSTLLPKNPPAGDILRQLSLPLPPTTVIRVAEPPLRLVYYMPGALWYNCMNHRFRHTNSRQYISSSESGV